MSKDYYKILGIEKNSSKDDVKKAFHKMAHKYHPDKKDGDEAKFKEVNEAYQTLHDDQKRAQYDQFGSEGPQMGGGASGQGFGGFDFSNFSQEGGDFGFDLGDMFGGMFGGGRAKTRRGADLQTNMQLEFKDAIFGVERELKVKKPSTCTTCKGDGAKPGTHLETCTQCNGKGSVRNIQRTIIGSIATNQLCDKCMGACKIPKIPCETCHGKGIVNDTRTIKVAIPAGIQNGETLRLANMGEAVQGGTSGDLYVHISVIPHKSIQRQGSDLITVLPIKLTDALLGAEYAIETLDGSLPISVEAGTRVGESVTIKGKGVPINSHKRGNFIVKLDIKLPDKLSRETKEIIEELKKHGI